IDALAPALQALPGGVAASSQAARSGADRTAQMTRAKAGRASYLSQDKLAGHKDPGAEGVARLFQALASR
ncbi:MAG: DAK2 domain-containing protein, partial [Rhodobacter sp.]|nr:DAK2 domain-containing protein [Rhodobacter sp.]